MIFHQRMLFFAKDFNKLSVNHRSKCFIKAIIISVKLMKQIIKMNKHVENIDANYQQIHHKQFVNFKQLLKLKSLKKARKIDQERCLKDKNILKDQMPSKKNQENTFQNSYFKLPLEAKSFQEINLKQSNQYSLGRSSHEVIFPLLKTEPQHSSRENSNIGINRSNKLANRGDFLQRVRQMSIEKLKDAVSNKKRKYKYFKSRESEQSLQSKVNCRSISPLTSYGDSSQKIFSSIGQGQYERFQCRISSSLQKASSRYQDIPIFQFIYDHGVGSSQLIERKLQTKMEKVWRKKSKNAKELTSHK